MNDRILYDDSEGLAVLTFNRPQQLNAMNRALMDELITCLGRAAQDERVRVIVLTGKGKAFMAGADIKEYAAQTAEQFEYFQRRGQLIYETIEKAPKPVIAAVNGFALGGGFEIALACDLIVASRSAQMGFPEISLDLIPGGGGTQRLPHKVGLSRALDLLLTGRRATAEELHAWGLICWLAEPEETLSSARTLANKLAQRSPDALAHLKMLACIGARGEPAGFEKEGQRVRELFSKPQAQARIAEFVRRSHEKAARDKGDTNPANVIKKYLHESGRA